MIKRHPLTSILSALVQATAGLLLTAQAAAADDTTPTIAMSDYDAHLCRDAQLFLINADAQTLPVVEQVGYGNGFHVIQMDVRAGKRQVIIAMTADFAELDGTKLATHVSCKTVDRDRVNDVLGMQLPGPNHQCGEINELTYEQAMAGLSPEERSRYLTDGRKLTFGDDALIATGGEWLPIPLDDFIQPSGEAGNDLVIRSPSVRVPWNRTDRQFYQGTQHCKLITRAAMEQWMRVGAFSTDTSLFPDTHTECSQPSSTTSTVGSCRFYFAPANTMFCQDFSGSSWTHDAAKDECGIRHASREALQATKNRFVGTGGIYSEDSCDDRDDTAAITGTCVFHCGKPEETLWQVSGTIDPLMTRGCELFVPR